MSQQQANGLREFTSRNEQKPQQGSMTDRPNRKIPALKLPLLSNGVNKRISPRYRNSINRQVSTTRVVPPTPPNFKIISNITSRSNSQKFVGSNSKNSSLANSNVTSNNTTTLTSGFVTPLPLDMPALQPIATFKIFLSSYPWDQRKAAIDELAGFLRSHHFEVFNNDEVLDEPTKTRPHFDRKTYIEESDFVVLFLNESYKKCIASKSEATWILRDPSRKKIAVISTDGAANPLRGWMEDLLPPTTNVIDFSKSSVFAEVALTVLQKIQLELQQKQEIASPLGTIKVKKRVGIPLKPESFFSRQGEGKAADAIEQLCRGSNEKTPHILVVSGPPGIGKSALIQHLLTDPKYESLLALNCKVQNIAWCSPGSSLATGSRTFIQRLCQLVNQSCAGTRSSATCVRNLGPHIDEVMIDTSRRFLLVVDNDANTIDQDDMINEIRKIRSQALRCIFITRSDVNTKKTFWEICVGNLSFEDIQTTLKQVVYPKQLTETTMNTFATQCDGSPLLTNLFQHLLSPKLENQHSALIEKIANLETNQPAKVIQALLKGFLDVSKMESLLPYFKLLFFGSGQRFNVQDVAVLLDCDEILAANLCWKLCGGRLLIRVNESVFVLPDWLYNAIFEIAKSRGVASTSSSPKDWSRHLLNVSLLHRAVEKRREDLLLSVLDESTPEILERLCRDQSSSNKMKGPFLQHLYNADWREVTCCGSKRNVALEVMIAYLKKLKEKTVSLLTTPDANFDCVLCQILRTGFKTKDQSLKTLRKIVLQCGGSKVVEALEEKRYWASQVRGSKDQRTTLCQAAIRGQLQTVHQLVKKATPNPNANDLEAAFLAACANGHGDVVRYLHWNGADVNAVDPETGDSALMMACRNGHCHIVAFLCQNGADVQITNREGQTVLIAASRRGCLDVVHYLLDEGGVNCFEKNRHNEESAVIAAARFGYISVVRLLVDQCARSERAVEETTAAINGALIAAADSGHLDMVEFLLSNRFVDVNAKDHRTGLTALIVSASNGFLDLVNILIGHQVDVNTASLNGGFTALHGAVMNNHVDVANVLLSKGADATLKNADGLNALMCAARNGYLNLVEILLDHCGYDQQDIRDGATFMLAMANNDADVVECLLDHGADVNAPRNGGVNGLLMAAQNGNVQLVKILLSRGANCQVRSKDGSTALILASGSKNASVEMLELFWNQKGCDINAKSTNGWTALMAASFGGNRDIVNWLVANGADVNAKTDSAGATALISACRAGHYDIVQYLVANCNADVTIKTFQGVNALQFAETCGHLEIAQYLMSKGARGSKMDPLNKTFQVVINNKQPLVGNICNYNNQPKYC